MNKQTPTPVLEPGEHADGHDSSDDELVDDSRSDDEPAGHTSEAPEAATVPEIPARALQLGCVMLVIIAAALAAVVGVLAMRYHHVQQDTAMREQSIVTAELAATNMTSIDWQRADQDVAKILDGATGSYRDDFAARSGPLAEVIKTTKASSKGAVVEAAIESSTDTTTQVLVTVEVTTTDQYTPQPTKRSWRMRMAVQPQDEAMKVAKVEFLS